MLSVPPALRKELFSKEPKGRATSWDWERKHPEKDGGFQWFMSHILQTPRGTMTLLGTYGFIVTFPLRGTAPFSKREPFTERVRLLRLAQDFTVT